MSDIYLTIADQTDETIEAIVASMEARGTDPQMQRFCADYLGRVGRTGGAVVEIGCGNGVSSGEILRHLKPECFIGIDPAEGLLRHAKKTFADNDAVSFAVADAYETDLENACCDVVVAHTIYSHLAEPERALSEAFRILRPGGTLAIFDGDYAANTVALRADDPLQEAMQFAEKYLIHAPYIMRSLPALAKNAGFVQPDMGAHGFVQSKPADYILSLMSRGLQAACNVKDLSQERADTLLREAHKRIEEDRFYGAILFVSLILRKPEN